MPLLKALLLGALALLSACATTVPSGDDWPASIPPRSHYETVYAEDLTNQRFQSQDEYLTWVIRFYQGWELYDLGWQQMSSEVLETMGDPAERAYMQETLDRLGKRISAEWAKDNRGRVIATPTMITWGSALRQSVQYDQQIELARKVSADVDALFEGRILRQDISLERYYGPEQESEFF